MKICSYCGASNSEVGKFCNECSTAFNAPTVEAETLADALRNKLQALEARRQADIMFVLDCTGSMRGEIDAIRDAIVEFADTIKSEGVRVRIGLIAFRDRLLGEEHRALSFDGEIFTREPAIFRREVAKLKAGGGGDEPESSLDALMLALRQPFAVEGQKAIVLVTDAPPHIPDKEVTSFEEVAQAFRRVGVEQFYLVGRLENPQSQIYLKFLEGRKGMAFDLGKGDDFRSRAEHFKQTLKALGKTISNATR